MDVPGETNRDERGAEAGTQGGEGFDGTLMSVLRGWKGTVEALDRNTRWRVLGRLGSCGLAFLVDAGRAETALHVCRWEEGASWLRRARGGCEDTGAGERTRFMRTALVCRGGVAR